MRRLPVYLLVDTSGSMYGEAIEAVRSGLQLLLGYLRQDPYALETAYLSVITFNSEARQVAPLTDLPTFQLPTIEANGITEMGSALRLLAECIEREVQKGSAEVKGDWKPIVFLLSDGAPTDDIEVGLRALERVKIATFVACGAGSSADLDTLKRIVGEKGVVVRLDTADSKSIGAFFKWVSQSVSVSSKKIDLGKEPKGADELPPPPPELNVVL